LFINEAIRNLVVAVIGFTRVSPPQAIPR